MKHTPGPWIKMENFAEGPFYIYPKPINKRETKFFATVTNEADARLIAAAPELLELLESLDEWFDANGMPLSPHAISLSDEDITVADLLKREIAKAKGGA